MSRPALSARDEERLRREIVAASRSLWERGWVANHDGNLTACLGEGRLLATPTAVGKGDVTQEMLIVVDAANQVVSGTRKLFSELQLHRAAFDARPDIGVCMHAHPPTATGFAVAGVALGHPFMAEPVVSLGPEIPVVAWHRPGAPELGPALAEALGRADVVLLDRHGVLVVGGSFEQALLRLELVEHLARIALVAHQLGGVRPLAPADVAALSAKGRPPSEPSFGQVPAAPSPVVPSQVARPAAESGPRPDVRNVVSEALRRLR